MELKTFKVRYYPSPESSAISECIWTGKDEEDCLKTWRDVHPLWAVKEIKEQ
jgi:hypothetical protein